MPTGRLPADVRPLGYDLELAIVPGRERFRGSARIEIELDRPQRRIWLHGRGLDVGPVRVERPGEEPLIARFEQVTEEGVAALDLPAELGPGRLGLHLEWSAPFDRTLQGLYAVELGGDAYAFTQLEPFAARSIFPGFDEPAFKTPFQVTLIAPAGGAVVANTPAVAEEPLPGGLRRVRFAPTPKLPTYLLAFAVGPLDVVEAAPLPPGGPRQRPVPFRGVAARDRGPDLAFALAHTPPLVADLERYFDREYPYAKLDVIAVPDFDSGAMENVGAITFREYLLLLDPHTAPEVQRRAFTNVMSHELAHQWFGNLVTMPWWDDLWLNEAFATWLASRSVARVRPEQRSELALLQAVHRAMDVDSLVSARSIRQPITSHHDIHNAFDAITYSKGAGVLAMFERWLGEATFRDGIRLYVERHAEGSARAEDLTAALSLVSGRDVGAPFTSFLTQPGVPFLEVATRCGAEGARLELRQSRYLPLGSEGERDAVWQVPVCARFAAGGRVEERCALVERREGQLPLGAACPEWVMPNADGAGYYRFAQPAEDAERLLSQGFAALSPLERLALADGLGAALGSGARPAAEVYAALPVLAADSERAVATAPLGLLKLADEYLSDAATRPAVERYGQSLYRPLFDRLGWRATPGEDGETRLLREQLLWFLTQTARDGELRRQAAHRGRLFAGVDGPRRPDALEPELVEAGLAAAVQEGGAPVFDALLEQAFASPDALARSQRLGALGASEDPELLARALALAFEPRLRVNEVLTPMRALAQRPATREAVWDFVRERFDDLVARLGREGATRLAGLVSGFCDEASAREVEEFLGPRFEALAGGPRDLATALEKIRLCAALAEAQSPSARAFFAGVGS